MKIKRLILIYDSIDDWNRPVFKHIHSNLYFGSTTRLVPDKDLGLIDEQSIVKYFNENSDLLEYFGSSKDCDPIGTRLVGYTIKVLTKEEFETKTNQLESLIDKLEINTEDSNLNKIVLKNTKSFLIPHLDNLKYATMYIFRTVEWKELGID